MGEPLDLMQYLPAIFRERLVDPEVGAVFRRDDRKDNGRQTSDPLHAIVRTYEENTVARAEKTLRELPRYFDADQATHAPGWPIADFLGMLARWVAIDSDEIGMDGASEGGAWAERNLRFVVKNAAAFHAVRGTPHGLRYMLEVFCDANVEILEWTWPRGFEVDASAVGIDTFLSDQPDVAHCLTVIWKNPPAFGDDPDTRLLETPCLSEIGEMTILNLVRTTPEPRSNDALERRLTRMKRLLTLESPAHVTSFLALEAAAALPQLPAQTFVVELTSTVGSFWLETSP